MNGHLGFVIKELEFLVALLERIQCIPIVKPLSLAKPTLLFTRWIRSWGNSVDSGLEARMTCYQRIAIIFVMSSVKSLVCLSFRVSSLIFNCSQAILKFQRSHRLRSEKLKFDLFLCPVVVWGAKLIALSNIDTGWTVLYYITNKKKTQLGQLYLPVPLFSVLFASQYNCQKVTKVRKGEWYTSGFDEINNWQVVKKILAVNP